MNTGVLISRPETTQAKALARVVRFLGRGVAWRGRESKGGGREGARGSGRGSGGCFVLRCAR